MKVFEHINTMDDIYDNSIAELANDGITIERHMAEAMVKSRYTTMIKGMREGKNIKFHLLGVITISLGKFQRANIRRKLKAKYNDSTALTKAVNAEMKVLADNDKLISDNVTAITKSIKHNKPLL